MRQINSRMANLIQHMLFRSINYFFIVWRACLQSLENLQWLQITSASWKRSTQDAAENKRNPAVHTKPSSFFPNVVLMDALAECPTASLGVSYLVGNQSRFLRVFLVTGDGQCGHLTPLFASQPQIRTNVYTIWVFVGKSRVICCRQDKL